MLTWNITQQHLELLYPWKISRNTSTLKTNLFVTVTDGTYSGTGEVAPNIRYGETPDLIMDCFARFINRSGTIVNLDELTESTKDFPNSLRFGMEAAFLFYTGNKTNRTLSELMYLPEPLPVPTSYTLPIMEASEISAFIKTHQLDRFSLLKLKVNQENATDLTRTLFNHCQKPVCIDANEAFPDPDRVLHFLETVSDIPIRFLEQPLPSAQEDAGIYLKSRSTVPIFADESVTSNPDMEKISGQFHGINMKLMKAGGFMHGKMILQEAKRFNLSTMIGCMIETSLGIRSAIYLTPLCQYYDLDGMFHIKNEPFNMVSEQTGYLLL